GEAVWDRLTSWQHVRRAKIIIDETPNFVTEIQINSNLLSQTLGALRWLRDANKQLYTGMKTLLCTITDASIGHRNRLLSDAELECIHSIDTELIRKHLSCVEDYALTLDCGSTKPSLRTVCRNTLSRLKALQSNGWGWVSFRGQTAQINSATLHP